MAFTSPELYSAINKLSCLSTQVPKGFLRYLCNVKNIHLGLVCEYNGCSSLLKGYDSGCL